MKKSLRLITAFCFAILINCSSYNVADAQYVTIPDPNFVNCLQWYVPNCMNGNQLDTTCSDIANVFMMQVNLITQDLEGIQYFYNLQSLDNTDYPYGGGSACCVPSFPPSLQYINLGGYFTSLPPIPQNVTYLSLNGYTATMPSLPIGLQFLSLENDYSMPLPVLPPNLKTLYWEKNTWDTLPNLPASLETLYCRFNQLQSLPALPNGLRYLNCEYNNITDINALPDSLRELYCAKNSISTLPNVWPDFMNYVDCSNNLLSSIDSLPLALDSLNCSSNNLINLAVLSLNLSTLDCSLNQLPNLPNLPLTLSYLDCSNNLLTALPQLPSGLKTLYCSYNSLVNLPDLPDTMQSLDIKFNSQLHCMPKLKTISYFGWEVTDILCLPNYGNIANSYPLLSSVPLCNIFNTNGCQFFWNITGKVYADTSANCIYDNNEKALQNIKVRLYKNSTLIQESFTINNGDYTLDIDSGNFTIKVDTTDLPFYVSCPISGFNSCYVPSIDSVVLDKNFGVICKPGFDVGVNAIVRTSGIFRPANYATLNIKAGDITNKYGLNCASGISGTVTIIINGPASYVSAAIGSLTPTVNGDTLAYSIADFGTVNFNSDFKIIVQTDTLAAIGSQICFDVNVTPTSGDNNPSNNNLQNCFTVVGSFDPNDKTVYPVDRMEDKNGTLTYTINFQNTGTAPAQHIYILDTLDASIYESSFELLAYSHQPQVQIIGNVARFNFPNINLPDSVNDEPNSHGYVQYRVKLKDSLPQATIIQNTSYIYFDFNSPVQTNTVVDTLTDCNNLASIQFTNPNFCNGDTVFANAVLGYNSNTDWYVDSLFVSSNQNISIPNLSIGNHEIKLIASNTYCNVDVVSTIQVHDLPVFNLGNDTATCNVLVQLDAGLGNISYQWSNGESTQSIIADATNNYSVVVTDANGCVNSDSVNIVVNPLPTIELGNDTATCNVLVQLDAGSGNISYQWSNSETTQTIIVTATNNYSVIVTDTNGCSNFDSISITINALPVVTLNAFPNPDTLCINSGVQTISNGYPIGGTLSGTGVSGNNFNPALAGTGWHVITYSYTDSNGCANIANDSVFVDLCLGVNSISGNETINIYPNPATDEITISYNFKNSSHIKIELYNSIGEKIKVLVDEKQPAGKTLTKFRTLSGLSKGIYFVTMMMDGKVYARRLVVE